MIVTHIAIISSLSSVGRNRSSVGGSRLRAADSRVEREFQVFGFAMQGCVLSLHMQSGSSKQEGSGKLLLSKQSF